MYIIWMNDNTNTGFLKDVSRHVQVVEIMA